MEKRFEVKVGDTVRILNTGGNYSTYESFFSENSLPYADKYNGRYVEEGMTGKVLARALHIYRDAYVLVIEINNVIVLMTEDESYIEVVKFTKADLKAGYVVKQRCGVFKMVMPFGDGLELIANDGTHGNLSNYNEDMTNKEVSNNDIMEVYGLPRFTQYLLKASSSERELIWERPKEVKEISIDDATAILKEKYGCEVKIVEG